jgi:rhodanese-related sulfurtransferase
LRRVAQARLAEVERIARDFLAERGHVEEVDEVALRRRVRSGAVTLLDVRPPEEFEAGHIPGAISIRLPQLAKQLAELPKGKEVVAYCRGPYCVLAVEAVSLLRRKGFKATRLGDGISTGLPWGIA